MWHDVLVAVTVLQAIITFGALIGMTVTMSDDPLFFLALFLANLAQVVLHVVLAIVSPGTTPLGYTACWLILAAFTYRIWRKSKLSFTNSGPERRPDVNRT